MDAAQFLPTEPSPEVTQIHEGDYKDADGLWHCGVCGKARQKKINSPYFHKTVWCICDCRVKELEEQRRKEEYEEEMHRVQRLKDASMMASKFRDAEFSVYQKRTENQRAYDVSRKYAAQFRQMITEGNPKTGEKNLGLVFYGPCGTGKSFTAACIANELMEQNISVVMTSFVKILQDIQGQDEAAYIFYVYEPKKRMIMSITFYHRIVQWAIYRVINPLLVKGYIKDTYRNLQCQLKTW